MQTDREMNMRVLIVLLVAGLALSACGRRGSLQPPPGAALEQPQAAAEAEIAEEKPDTSFILDPLL